MPCLYIVSILLARLRVLILIRVLLGWVARLWLRHIISDETPKLLPLEGNKKISKQRWDVWSLPVTLFFDEYQQRVWNVG